MFQPFTYALSNAERSLEALTQVVDKFYPKKTPCVSNICATSDGDLMVVLISGRDTIRVPEAVTEVYIEVCVTLATFLAVIWWGQRQQ